MNVHIGQMRDTTLKLMGQIGWTPVVDDTIDFSVSVNDCPNTYTGYCGPAKAVLQYADSHLKLLLFFLPKTFWVTIAEQTNLYERSTREDRIAKRLRNPNNKMSEADIKNEIYGFEPICPHEILQMLGLLMARTLAPQRGRFQMHWAMHP